jgi:CTP:molybdopterin cytidylyltransferase MocA
VGAGRIVKERAAAGQLHLLPVDDRGICTDIDTVQDLAAVERRLGAGAAGTTGGP